MSQPRKRQAFAVIEKHCGEAEILDWVAAGMTQVKIAERITQETGHPVSQRFISQYLNRSPEASAKWKEAREASAHMLADKVLDVADRVVEGKLDPASARVGSEAYRWLASKRAPAEYGERLNVDLQVADVTQLHLEALRQRMAIVSSVPEQANSTAGPPVSVGGLRPQTASVLSTPAQISTESVQVQTVQQAQD